MGDLYYGMQTGEQLWYIPTESQERDDWKSNDFTGATNFSLRNGQKVRIINVNILKVYI